MSNNSITSQVLVGVLVTVISAVILAFIGIRKDGSFLPNDNSIETNEISRNDGNVDSYNQASLNESNSIARNLNSSASNANNQQAAIQPIKNLFSAWENLSLTDYMTQWQTNARQQSSKFSPRTYNDIYAQRKSLFSRLNAVTVDKLEFIKTTEIEREVYLIIVKYSMTFYMQNGKTIKEDNITETYSVRYNNSESRYLIEENYDYAKDE